MNLHLIDTNFLVHSRYEQAVEDPFHISKACLEPTSVKDGKSSITSVYIEVDDEEFLLCNLSDKVLNESLDLNFNTGDKLVFKTSVSIFDFIMVLMNFSLQIRFFRALESFT